MNLTTPIKKERDKVKVSVSHKSSIKGLCRVKNIDLPRDTKFYRPFFWLK